MKIRGGLLTFLIFNLLGAAMIFNHMVVTQSYNAERFEFYLWILSLVLRALQYLAFFKRHWLFCIFFFADYLLHIIIALSFYKYAIVWLVLDFPWFLYLLFSQTVKEYAPFPKSKRFNKEHFQIWFDNWMYRRMAWYKFLHEDNDAYIADFIEAQEKQYAPWKYYMNGRPEPMLEAKGNAKYASYFWFGQAALLLGINTLVIYVTTIPDILHDLGLTIVFLLFFPALTFGTAFIGWRFLQKHYRRKYSELPEEEQKRIVKK